MSGFNTMSEKKSYRGVYYNIEDSDICVLFNGIYLYFCSQAIADHFEKNFPTYKEKALKRLKSILPTVRIGKYRFSSRIRVLQNY